MSLSISTYIAIISTDILKNPGFDLEEIGKISLESVTDDFRKEFRTIEKPSTTTIGNQDASTFLITQQDKYKNFDVKEAKQYWIVLKDDDQYLIAFTSLAENFDSPENVEIRDHFINSIKFLNDNESEDESEDE